MATSIPTTEASRSVCLAIGVDLDNDREEDGDDAPKELIDLINDIKGGPNRILNPL